MRALGLSSLILLVLGCEPDETMDAGSDSGLDDTGADAGTDAGSPPCDGPSGLYQDDACEIVAADLRLFEPQYVLWADGAAKERYVFLPPGSQIDTSDPNNWVFPVGTRIYKTFSLGGVRLETRLLEKVDLAAGPGAWDMRVFAWNLDQDAVTEVTLAADPERQNVLGTDHDIPSAAQCTECHSGTRDAVAGFSAIQLNHADAGTTLQNLMDEGLLTDAIALTDAVIPGDATARAGLGYLHVNCGHCHHAPLPVSPPDTEMCHTLACVTGLHMWMDVGTPSVEMSATYLTAVNQPSTFFVATAPCRIHPGMPGSSVIIARMSVRGEIARMPPLATEIVHSEGVTAVSAWISTLSGADPRCVP